jgi:hypothetical protein
MFTFILDFEGGTYISQHESRSKTAALQAWVKSLTVEEIQGMSPEIYSALQAQVFSHTEGDFTPITGTFNVWCTDFDPLGRFMILNIVRTATD